jgi:hypothetical protein
VLGGVITSSRFVAFIVRQLQLNDITGPLFLI